MHYLQTLERHIRSGGDSSKTRGNDYESIQAKSSHPLKHENPTTRSRNRLLVYNRLSTPKTYQQHARLALLTSLSDIEDRTHTNEDHTTTRTTPTRKPKNAQGESLDPLKKYQSLYSRYSRDIDTLAGEIRLSLPHISQPLQPPSLHHLQNPNCYSRRVRQYRDTPDDTEEPSPEQECYDLDPIFHFPHD